MKWKVIKARFQSPPTSMYIYIYNIYIWLEIHYKLPFSIAMLVYLYILVIKYRNSMRIPSFDARLEALRGLRALHHALGAGRRSRGSGAAPSPRGCGLRKLFGKGSPWEIHGKIWEIHGKTWENPAKICKNGDLNGKSHINCWNTLDLRWLKHQPWWKKWDLTWSKHQEWWKHCDCGKIVCQPWRSCNKQNPSTWQMKTKQLKAPI